MTEQQDRRIESADSHDRSSRNLHSLDSEARSLCGESAKLFGASMKCREIV
jgi:hypothetical protein